MHSIDTAVEAVKLGAEDYLLKPMDLPRVRGLLRSTKVQFENRGSVFASDAALAERLEFCGMVGRSPQMLELFDMIRRFAPHARTVLISGETGAGKELVARALHQLGPRRDKRFVTVNCSAVVETLFESELFGHARGAFTGATEHKQGLFEVANGGTLFLDEAGELPLSVQGKLLRCLKRENCNASAASTNARWTCESWRPPTGRSSVPRATAVSQGFVLPPERGRALRPTASRSPRRRHLSDGGLSA